MRQSRPDDFHRRLAQIAFDAGDDLGLVLSGGYAIAMHELTSRPSHDVEFATASPLPRQKMRALHDRALHRHFIDVHAAYV